MAEPKKLPRCLYCGLEIVRRSREHLLPAALGGRRVSRRICCGSCNNKLNEAVDRPFLAAVAPLTTILGKRTGRGRPVAPIRGLRSEGLPFSIESGGTPRLAKPVVERRELEGGREQVLIRADTREAAEEILGQILADPEIRRTAPVVLEEQSGFLDDLDLRVSLGGASHFRQTLKCALNLLAAETRDNERLREATSLASDYATKGRPLPAGWVGHAFPVDWLPRDPIGRFDHRIMIATSAETGLAAGVLELFGAILSSCVLSDSWQGQSLTVEYALDPSTEKHRTRRLPGSKRLLLEEVVASRPTPGDLKSRMAEFFLDLDEHQRNSYLESEIDGAFAAAGVSEDGPATDEQRRLLAGELATRLSRLVLRLPGTRRLD